MGTKIELKFMEKMEKNKKSVFVFAVEDGDSNIYSSSLVSKPETKPGALESPVFEDIRGKIERKEFGGNKFNIIETKKGFMRSGDLHKNRQFDLVLSGRIELWTLDKDGATKKEIVSPNQLVVLGKNVPHLFHFLENTVMIEYWDGPFEAWFYKPYRDIIDEQFRKNVQKLDAGKQMP